MYLMEMKGQMCIFKCTNINSMYEPAGEDRNSTASLQIHLSLGPFKLSSNPSFNLHVAASNNQICFSTIMYRNNLREKLLCSLACSNRRNITLTFHPWRAAAGLYLHTLHFLKAFLPLSCSSAVRNPFQICFFL